MKQKVFLFFLFSILNIYQIYAQSTIIRVEGMGSDFYKPDQAIIQLYLSVESRTAREAYQQMEEKLKTLTQLIKKSGYSDSTLKVQSINVSKYWNADKQKEKSYQASFSGNIKLPAQTLEVMEVVEKIEAQISTSAYVSFSFSNQKQKQIKETLMIAALEDARNKAKKIAAAYDLSMLSVKEVQFTSQPMPIYAPMSLQRESKAMDVAYSAGNSIDMAIQDQEFFESVQVVFEAK